LFLLVVTIFEGYTEILPKIHPTMEKRFLIEDLKNHVEIIKGNELTQSLIHEISRFRRYIFNNEYKDFLVFPSTGETTSAQNIFEKEESQYVDIDQMDSLKNLPVNPKTGEKAVVYRHPKKMEELISNQLKGEEGQVGLFRENGEVLGLIYGYRTFLKRVFELEWSNKYLYTENPPQEYDRSWDDFVDLVNNNIFDKSFFKEKTPVYSWNCLGVDPQARGKGVATMLMNKFFEALDYKSKEADIPVAGDLFLSAKTYEVFKKADGFYVDGFLNSEKKSGEEVLIFASLKKMINNLTNS